MPMDALNLASLLDSARGSSGVAGLSLVRLDRAGRVRDVWTVTPDGCAVEKSPGDSTTPRVRDMSALVDAGAVDAVSSRAFGHRIGELLAPLGERVHTARIGTERWLAGFLVTAVEAGPPASLPGIAMLAATLSEMERVCSLVTDDATPGIMLERTFMQVDTAMLQGDRDGRVMRLNSAAAALLGFTPEVCKTPWTEHLLTRVEPPLAAAISDALANPGGPGHTLRRCSAGGATSVLQVSAHEVRDDEGGRMASLVYLNDITTETFLAEQDERNSQLEQAIDDFDAIAAYLQSEKAVFDELCRLVVEVAGYPSAWVADNDWERSHTSVTASCCTQPHDHIGGAVAMINDCEDTRRYYDQGVMSNLPGVRHLNHSTQPVCRLGESCGLNVAGGFRLDHLQRPRHVLFVYAKDETHLGTRERRLIHRLTHQVMMALEHLKVAAQCRQAERDLIATSRWMLAMVQASPSAIISVDVAGRIVSVNPEAVRIAGITEEDFVGKTASDVLVGPSRSGMLSMVDAVLKGERLENVEVPFSIVGGRSFWARVSARVLRDERGKVEGAVFIAFDVSESKQLEKRERLKDRRIREMAAEMVLASDRQRRQIAMDIHDGPAQLLAAIRMNLQVLHARGSVDDADGRFLKSVGLLAEVTDSLRTLTFSLYPESLRSTGLNGALDAMVSKCDTNGRCKWRYRGNDVEVDDEQASILYRVARELMRNVERHAEATRASIRLECVDGWVVLEVDDNGCGVPESAKDNRGIGLTGAAWQVERRGGCMEVDSPGAGTRVTVRLPLSANETGARQV